MPTLPAGEIVLIAFTLVFFALQLADWYSTRTILAKGGREQNPVARALIGILGVDGFLGAKTVAATAVGYWIGSQVIYFLAVLICLYFIVVRHNWRSM
jgi:hypothetical protein